MHTLSLSWAHLSLNGHIWLFSLSFSTTYLQTKRAAKVKARAKSNMMRVCFCKTWPTPWLKKNKLFLRVSRPLPRRAWTTFAVCTCDEAQLQNSSADVGTRALQICDQAYVWLPQLLAEWPRWTVRKIYSNFPEQRYIRYQFEVSCGKQSQNT